MVVPLLRGCYEYLFIVRANETSEIQRFSTLEKCKQGLTYAGDVQRAFLSYGVSLVPESD